MAAINREFFWRLTGRRHPFEDALPDVASSDDCGDSDLPCLGRVQFASYASSESQNSEAFFVPETRIRYGEPVESHVCPGSQLIEWDIQPGVKAPEPRRAGVLPVVTGDLPLGALVVSMGSAPA